MERTFAGFWRDGAKAQPEDRHADATGYVIGFSKSKKEFFCCHAMRPAVWSEFYWLDTTTPTELTPQEAFELIKVVYPSCKQINNNGDNVINWGDTTEYPPKKKWRVPTDADKGKKCRVSDDGKRWSQCDHTFITEFRGMYLASLLNDVPFYHKHCEVLDE
jgi:hypothetical protein